MRHAIGATDGQLFRQLFAQSTLLGIAARPLARSSAIPGVDVLVASLPADVPRAGSITVDTPVLLLSTRASVSRRSCSAPRREDVEPEPHRR